MVTITNEMTCGNFSYESADLKLTGDFKVNPAGKVHELNGGSIQKSGLSIGNFNARMDSMVQPSSLKVSINNVPSDNMNAASAAVNVIIGDLETKYKPVTK